MKQVQTEIDEFMAEYDSTHSKRSKRVTVTEPDEQGWQTVVGAGGGRARAKQQSIVPTTTTSNNNKRRKRKHTTPQTADDFYRFQIKQSKMQHIEELRKKFEQDKQRIALMKANRKFRPY